MNAEQVELLFQAHPSSPPQASSLLNVQFNVFAEQAVPDQVHIDEAVVQSAYCNSEQEQRVLDNLALKARAEMAKKDSITIYAFIL